MARRGAGEMTQREMVEPQIQETGLEGEWPPKWMTTYSDMTTILLTFFVLWYANTMLNVDKTLVEIASADSFKIVKGAEIERMDVRTFDQEVVRMAETMTAEQEFALTELSQLVDREEELRQYLEAGELLDKVEVKIVGEDVVILPSSDLLFAEGSAVVRSSFYPVLDKIAKILKDCGAGVRIEGHTDDVPIHPRHRRRFPSNWELSSARAIAVGNYFIARSGIRPERISVCGYGDALPRVPNDSPENRALNRRVEFHIYANSEM